MDVKKMYLYGYDRNSPFLRDLSIREKVNYLKKQGIDGVFGGYREKEFVQEMHEQEMKVFVSFKCFSGSEEWEMNPQSRPVNSDGSLFEKEEGYYGLNPSNKRLQKERLDSLEKLLANEYADGVWFDFIRWPCKWEKDNPNLPETSFDQDTIEQFLSEYPIDLRGDSPDSWAREILHEHNEKWRIFRCSIITDWLKKAFSLVKRSNPTIPVGVFTVPWINGEGNNGLINTMGQDIKAMSSHTNIFSPMVYHKICHKPKEWIGQVYQWYEQQTEKEIWPIIQSVDMPQGSMDSREYKKTLDFIKEEIESPGFIIFSLDGHLSLVDLN